MKWLKDAIVEYIKNNPMCDSVDIVSHFGLRADIIMNCVQELESENRVTRQNYFGTWFRYEIVK